jgi:hypothetical protein
MIRCKELDIDFSDKESMFLALKKYEDKIIGLKKSNVMKSHEKGQFVPNIQVREDAATKAGFAMKAEYFYPIINTTNYMDSHSDVHFPNLWNKSIKDHEGHFYYVLGHDLEKMTSVIAYPEDVKAFTRTIDWKLIGKDYEGTTQALIYEIPYSAIQIEQVDKAIREKRALQNSVRMQYIDVFFAVNSKNKDLAENYKLYNDYIDQIANKDEVEAQGYFYGVTQAKIYKEGSLVLFGSNDATPIMYKVEAANSSTSIEIEPHKSTHKLSLLMSVGKIHSQIKN